MDNTFDNGIFAGMRLDKFIFQAAIIGSGGQSIVPQSRVVFDSKSFDVDYLGAYLARYVRPRKPWLADLEMWRILCLPMEEAIEECDAQRAEAGRASSRKRRRLSRKG